MLICQSQHYQAYLDASTPYTTYRWVGSGVLLFLFFLRIFLAQGWYIGMTSSNPWKWNQQSENDALRRTNTRKPFIHSAVNIWINKPLMPQS